MRKFSLMRRLLIFSAGIMMMGLGVAVTTRASLGTSPISAVPYVMTFFLPLSFGTATFLVNILLVLGQFLMLRRNFPKSHCLQLPAVLLFGIFIDLGMYVSGFFPVETYEMKIAELLIGCALLAAGIVMEIMADVLYLPGEGFIRALHLLWKKEFGTLKIGFDLSITLLAVMLSFCFLRKLEGVREGTVIAVAAVGLFVRFLLPHARFLRKWQIVPARRSAG